VRDDEFIAGRLDTAFIARFSERRGLSHQAAVSARQDIAIIAAAVAYARARRKVSPSQQPVEQSKWKMSGREAGLNSGVKKKSPQRR
jgi:hypothetical protein